MFHRSIRPSLIRCVFATLLWPCKSTDSIATTRAARTGPILGASRACVPNNAGFTLLEAMIVVSMMGILVTMSVPSWVTFWATRNLSASQDQVYHAVRLAQSEAKRHGVSWQASFQDVNGEAQWAIHAHHALPNQINWQILPAGIQIDPTETTMARSRGVYRIQFSAKGHVNGQLGRLTLKTSASRSLKRCVVVSTMIGGIRKSQQQNRPQNGRYCY
jgi:prepilin-type N-terminal cleavage/methylation domain-containing protein